MLKGTRFQTVPEDQPETKKTSQSKIGLNPEFASQVKISKH